VNYSLQTKLAWFSGLCDAVYKKYGIQENIYKIYISGNIKSLKEI